MELKELHELVQKQGEAFHALKEVLEKGKTESSDTKTKLDSIHEKMDKYEDINEEVAKKSLEETKAHEELKEKFAELEAQLCRQSVEGEKKSISDELKALERYVSMGEEKMQADEVKYLRTDSNIDGGYLVEPEYVREILKKITEISAIRTIATVRQTARNRVMVPIRQNLIQGGWNGEAGTAPEGQSDYGFEEIPLGRLSVFTILTNEVIQDASFNMEAETQADTVERFAQLEGAAFIGGNGENRPQGFLTDSRIAIFNTGNANEVTADALIDITGQLKVGYNPTYVLNRRTLAKIRQLKDGVGQYLWAPGIATGKPNTIIGEPYLNAIDMPDVAAGEIAVAYGDFRRGYWIVDRTQMTMIRDPFTRANKNQIVLTFHRRLTGQVVLPEAIKLLRVAA